MKNSEYWQQRSLELENAAYKDSEQYKKELEQLHKETLEQINKDIAYWYLRFAKKNKITYAEAQQILNKNELDEFHWTVQQYIKYGQSEILSDSWRKELENASIKVHVTRLESLQLQMRHHLEKEYTQRITDIKYLLKSGLEEDIYQNAYEIEKGLGVGVDLYKYNESEIEDILKKPWTSDGKVFSERLWGRKRQLVADLVEKDLPQALIRGESNDKIINRWAEKLDADRKAVGRVVRTERAYVNSRAALESYKKLGVKKYQILATLDLKTSNICREMDHKGRNKDEPFFYLDEYKVGLTAPPFHCNCRTTTVPYFDDFTEDEERAARDENGKYKKVPANMSYDEWYEKYVKDNPKALAAEKKMKNKSSDKKQYEEYKKILGNEVPKSFDKFQELKYNNSNEWDLMKDYVKSRSNNMISAFNPFSDYKKYKNKIDNEIVGLTTSNGIKITGQSKHFIERALGTTEDPHTGRPRSGVELNHIRDAIQNGNIRTRKNDPDSIKFITEKCIVSINPNTGILIQANPQ
ncbi:NAD(+)--arginine ADP-ribosyltransferase EFV [Clostridium puniceum]|uniref:NAD(+)--arginine ADP-ribosyltransferase EFV n=1 Tax=Clostridium puniceum TaxID=29367 RepID=A0A1S8TX36_9CLOT|nr:minor capsid protein [Clostridium puniceum]OOM82316.1 NAD(+)--arginine ADP-ribosyltransferase EFV [Clostridium puniceum]